MDPLHPASSGATAWRDWRQGLTLMRAGVRGAMVIAGHYSAAILGLSCVVILWVAVILSLSIQKRQATHEALVETTNMARAFEESTIRSIRAIDQALFYVRGAYLANPTGFDLPQWSKNRQFLTDLTFQIAIIDKDGYLAASTTPGATASRLYLGDREHFTVHAGSATDELFISKPVQGRNTGRWTIQFTRTIRAPDGSFQGVAVVSLDPADLSRFFRSIDLGKQGVVVLVGVDGIVRARATADSSDIGQSLSAGRVLGLQAQAESGNFTSVSTIDAVRRVFAYRTVRGFPLIVDVGVGEQEILAGYRANLRNYSAVASVVTVFLLIAVALISRSQQRLTRTNAALRIARDEADRSGRAKSEFLAMMSHEIRSPMAGLLGVVELLRATPLGVEQMRMTEMVHGSAASLMRIVNDVLDFSKIEAGSMIQSEEPIALRELVAATVEPIALSMVLKQLGFTVSIDEDVPEWVSLDALRLRQILVNLLTNAVKFTGTGTVGLAVTCATRLADDPVLCFAITDTGIGMTREQLGRLFVPFSQADASTTKLFGGTGLGLTISRKLARLLGGDITVDSEAGRGSVFRLQLPLRCVAPAAPPVGHGLRESWGGRNDLHILVAEDQEINRWLIQRQLEHFGFQVTTTANGVEALATLATARFDLLITDCHMPGMDGTDLTIAVRRIEAASPGRARLPVLGLTADVTDQMLDQCRTAGMDEIVTKPINLGGLKAAITRILLGKDAAAEAEPIVAPAAVMVFDPTSYREMFQGVEAEGNAWLEGFLAAAVPLLDQIRAAVGADDRRAVNDAAHRLAGSSLSVGAMILGDLCRDLMAAAPDATDAEITRLLDAMQAAFLATQRDIIAFIAAHREFVV